MQKYYRGVARPFLIVPQTVCGQLQVGIWYRGIPSDESSEWWSTSSLEVALQDANRIAVETRKPVYVIEDCEEGFWIIAKAVM